MIERIFIPTVHRVDQQITFNHLPDELKGRVTMASGTKGRTRSLGPKRAKQGLLCAPSCN